MTTFKMWLSSDPVLNKLSSNTILSYCHSPQLSIFRNDHSLLPTLLFSQAFSYVWDIFHNPMMGQAKLLILEAGFHPVHDSASGWLLFPFQDICVPVKLN